MSPLPRPQAVYDENTHTLFLLGLRNQSAGIPGSYVNNATVTAYIEDEDGTQVYPTPSGTVTLTSLGAAVAVTLLVDERQYTFDDGNYSVALPDSIAWTPDSDGGYLLHDAIVAADDGTAIGKWKVDMSVAIRRAA